MRETILLAGLLASITHGCARGRDDRSGASLFAEDCARCHGVDGSGGPPQSPGQPPPRNLTDPAFQDARTDLELFGVIKSGKGYDMPPFGPVHGDAEIHALVGHVRSLRKNAR